MTISWFCLCVKVRFKLIKLENYEEFLKSGVRGRKLDPNELAAMYILNESFTDKDLLGFDFIFDNVLITYSP